MEQLPIATSLTFEKRLCSFQTYGALDSFGQHTATYMFVGSTALDVITGLVHFTTLIHFATNPGMLFFFPVQSEVYPCIHATVYSHFTIWNCYVGVFQFMCQDLRLSANTASLTIPSFGKLIRHRVLVDFATKPYCGLLSLDIPSFILLNAKFNSDCRLSTMLNQCGKSWVTMAVMIGAFNQTAVAIKVFSPVTAFHYTSKHMTWRTLQVLEVLLMASPCG